MAATLRLILIHVRAYRRRRGWLAWHVAVLVRGATVPSLDELTGETSERVMPSEEAVASRAARWFAVFDQMGG